MNKAAAPRRSVTSVGILCKLGQRLGSPLSGLLSGSSIAPAHLQDPHLEIRPEQELQVILNLVRLQGQTPGLGLMAGAEYHLATYGLWGYALLTCPNFGEAVHMGLRYLDLSFAFSRIDLDERSDSVAIVLNVDHLPPAARAFVLERDSSAIQVIQRELFGAAMPLMDLEFSMRPTAPVAQYEAVYGRVPLFESSRNAVVFSRDLLSTPLPKGNPASVEYFDRQLQQLLQLRTERGGTSAWIRNKLLANISNTPSLAQIASDHFMTERTLRRRLADEGTSFRDLLTEVRQTMAEELLCSTGLSVSEVSSRLGYASTSAFIHAFQKWRSCSPRQFLEARTQEKQGKQAG